MNRILVTGMGSISAIGENVPANHQALQQGRCGIGPLELFPTKYARLLPFGEIKLTNEVLRNRLRATEPGLTRTSLLAIHACDEAIADAGLSREVLADKTTALIGASTVGGMCLTEELYHDANKTEGGSEYLTSYDCAAATMHLQQRYQIGGVVNTINTACSSSANAILYGARLIRHGLAERAIVGGTDSLAKFTINGFNSLHILSSQACAPFDEQRQGLNLGEGAAFLVLEKESALAGRKAYASVSGYGNTNDAYHPSSISDEGDGPYLSMKAALDQAGLEPSAIQFINAHGTGTENNDLTESRAMLRLFHDVPAFASSKSYTGHTLGAAGAIEAVYSILTVVHQEVYASLHFTTPIADTGLQPVTNYARKKIKHVMSNSFGFGGNCTSLVFSAVQP